MGKIFYAISDSNHQPHVFATSKTQGTAIIGGQIKF